MNKNRSKLTETIEKLKADPNNGSLSSLLGEILKDYSLTDKWVPTVIRKGTNQILMHQVQGGNFIPVFSDEEYVIAKGNDVMVTSINKIILPLFEDPNIAGLEIDPFTMGLCIPTYQLINWIFGESEKYPEEKKNWGPGIPDYSDNDVMDEKRIQDFAIQIISDYIQDKNIEGMFSTNDPGAIPNALIRKDGKLAFVLVEGDIAPKMPELTLEKRKILVERSRQFGIECYYASVGFGSADPERFNSSLALIGDRYYARFEGLQRVNDLSN